MILLLINIAEHTESNYKSDATKAVTHVHKLMKYVNVLKPFLVRHSAL